MLDRAVRESVMIALSLVVFGTFMAFVGYLSYEGFSLRAMQENQVAFHKSLEVQKTLELYDNTDVTRDDVLIAVERFTQKYNIYILPYGITNPSSTAGIDLATSDSLSAWSIPAVSAEMKSNIDGSFLNTGSPVMYKANLLRDKYSNAVVGIEFTLENH